MKIENNYYGTSVEIETSKGEFLYSVIVDDKFTKFTNENGDVVEIDISKYGDGDWRVEGVLYSIEEIKSFM